MPDPKLASQLTIRSLTAEDCAPVSQAFTEQGWHKPIEQYQRYFQESLDGKREVLIAESAGHFAGYITIVWESEYAPFREAEIPEIVDFNVLKKYQRHGIGTALMDEAERRIAKRSPVAGIGVGMTVDYGPAQILYVKRGYLPDGRGLASHGQSVVYGSRVPIDDDLALYFTKPV